MKITILDIVALALVAIHFGVPLMYYYWCKKWLPKPWNIKTDPNYRPRVTVIVPTYNEAKLIEKKLDNIYEQKYPRDKMEVIVIDSASTDETPEKVKQWASKHPDLNLKLIQEPERRGKAHALNTALRHTTGDKVIITDVDAWWTSRNTLNETMKWLADPIVGAVSCLKKPATPGLAGIEEGYRKYYNTLRLVESKVWSTPIFHGELAAFKKNLLHKLGGFPTHIGADDSHTATRIALAGYRAVMPENVLCIETIPRRNYHAWRIRRAQHLIQHFTKTLRMLRQASKNFRQILVIESFLHLVNPYILLATIILLLVSILIMESITALIILALGIAMLIIKPYRTWITSQLYLIMAGLRNLWTKEIIWSKQTK